MSDAIGHSGRFTLYGAWIIAVASAIGFIICLVDYFMPHGDIAHSWGALLVLISTALMVIASLWIALGTLPRWALILFEVLIIFDILGTGFCAYMLESVALLVFMAIALIGWIWHLASDRPLLSAG